MLSSLVATWLVGAAGTYLVLGVIFAVPFATWLVNRMDPVAAQGTRTFRLLIVPGAVLLWPLLLSRLLRGVSAPPMERTAHRRSTR
jgi:hypothetical protein